MKGRPPKSLAQRFWSKVDKRGPDECWPWTTYRDGDGYGRIRLGGVGTPYLRANRAAWILHFGAIPDGLVVCHRCDNPPCVNPAHLFLGTVADNISDAMSKGRMNPWPGPRVKGEAHGRAKLTASQVSEIKGASGFIYEIAARFKIGESQVGRIRRGEAWVHLT